MTIDFRTKKCPLEPLHIHGEKVEQINTYKYLGVTIDDQLSWKAHSYTIYKKLNSRLYLLRQLKYFRVDKTLLVLFYKSILESLICFLLICWGGNARKQNKEKN